MAKTLQLSIPEPCHENWADMTPTEKGRFCAACQKEVVDFTNMREAELVAFFRKKKTGSVCGRFNDTQLNTEMTVPPKRIPWARYFFQITLPAFIASGKLMAQGKVVPEYKSNETVITVLAGFAKVKEKTSSPRQITTVKGQVIDETGVGIPYASLTNNKTKAGIVADSLGNFILKDVHVLEGSEYTVSAVGYTKTTFFASRINSQTKLQVQLIADNTLDEVIIISYGQTKGKTFYTGAVTKLVEDSLFSIEPRPIAEALAGKVADNKIIVTPNPVLTNKQITIQFNTETTAIYHYSILSMDGRLITSGKKDGTTGLNTITQAIDHRFTAGTYILSLQTGDDKTKQSIKFIVQR